MSAARANPKPPATRGAARLGRAAPRRDPRRGRRGRPRLRAVPPSKRRGPRRIPFLILSAALVGVLVVGVVSMQAFVSQASFKMQDLTKRTQQLRQSYADLRLEVAQLSSPDRIAKEAKRLGLRLPSEIQSLEVRGPADTPTGPTAGAAQPPAFAMKGLIGEDP